MGFCDYDANPDLNVSISGVNIGEGCPPSGINNAIRQIMADAKAEDGAVVHKTGAETVSGAKGFMEKISVYGGVELYPAGGMGANGGYIDFHYAGTTSDYTERIIGQNGELAIKGGGLVVSGSASAETLVVDKVNSASIVEVRGTYSSGATVGGYDMQLRANTNGNRGLYDPQGGAWAVRVDSGGSAYYAGGQVNGGLTVTSGLTVSGGIQMPELNTNIPAEDSANHSKFLRGDGKWRDVEYAASAGAAGSAGTITSTLPVSKGGTGKTGFSNTNGVLTAASTSAGDLSAVATANGALYATSAGAVCKFGTLPIAQGGTGMTGIAITGNSIKLPGGLILKWGTVSAKNTGTSVTFNTTYPFTAAPKVFVTWHPESAPSEMYVTAAFNVTTTGFTAYSFKPTGTGTSATGNCYWFAIGK